MEILLHARVIIILNYKNKFCTKQSNNHKWVSIIKIIYINNYTVSIHDYKKNVFFGIKIMIYLTRDVYDLMKIIKSLMKLI